MLLGHLQIRFVAACFAGLFVASACKSEECGGCPETVIEFPQLSSTANQSVTLTLQHVNGNGLLVSCSWGLTTTATTRVWTCTPADKSGAFTSQPYGGTLHYVDANDKSDWSIQLTGSSGTKTVVRTPVELYPGEGWPGTCSCTAYKIAVTNADLESVGAIMPDTNISDAGADAG